MAQLAIQPIEQALADEEPQFIDRTTVVRFLGIPSGSFSRFNDVLPPAKVEGGRYLYNREDVIAKAAAVRRAWEKGLSLDGRRQRSRRGLGSGVKGGVTVAEMAKVTGVSEMTIYSRRRQGLLPEQEISAAPIAWSYDQVAKVAASIKRQRAPIAATAEKVRARPEKTETVSAQMIERLTARIDEQQKVIDRLTAKRKPVWRKVLGW